MSLCTVPAQHGGVECFYIGHPPSTPNLWTGPMHALCLAKDHGASGVIAVWIVPRKSCQRRLFYVDSNNEGNAASPGQVSEPKFEKRSANPKNRFGVVNPRPFF